MQQLRLFFIALQFLTRCPVPRWVGYEPAWLQQSARWFPAVGTLVGAVAAGVLWASLQLWPPAVAVLLSMAASVWLTGGFHEDGWADSCDGLGGAVSRERALAIMKDSRIGSYGALGLTLMLGLKAACLVALASVQPALAVAVLVFAHTASRAAAVTLMRLLPYAGDVEHAKAKPLATQADGVTLAVALGWALSIGLLLVPGARLCAALLAIAAVVLWMRRWLRRRLGGYTGDNLGACQQLAELAALLAFAAR
ncbi:adenosylcobinamide-GDP ribazoletransferase [Pelomonas sp. KK5]|uniref:adenosylcobinamide-GDP ribazoletransferase n=1 Tax=Pelomonas sp. KK5 TaxID=1855730 RepID=UPI003511764C